jgi:hypothetical protein
MAEAGIAHAIALGRDPLQGERTPYEVLGIERGAGASDVERAFRAGLLQRGNVAALTAAKIALERAADRALIDLFLYDGAALAPLQPSPLDDPGALELPRRAATAAAWEALLRGHFPDPGLAHGLAVLWYWWARHAGPADAGPATPERWRRALSYWAMVAANQDFLRARAPVDPCALGDAIVERLRSDLRKLPAPARAPGAGEYGALGAMLDNEYGAAREVFAAGVHSKRGKFSCGPLVLKQFGLLDGVRELLEGQIEQKPGDRRMARLRDMLSHHAPIRALIEAGKPADALARIDALPEGPRLSPEVRALRARALLEIGREQLSVERFEEALRSWSQALQIGADADTEDELRAQIASASRVRAAALAQRPEQGIAVLERALALVSDPSLALALAELLHHRATERACGARERIDAVARATLEIMEIAERALAEMERASELGSAQAREDIPIPHALLEHARLLRAAAALRPEQVPPGAGAVDPAVARAKLAWETLRAAWPPLAARAARSRALLQHWYRSATSGRGGAA